MNKKILIIVLGILLISVVSADLVYEANTDIDLKIPCMNNNTYCSSSAECNFTTFYPNGSLFVSDWNMTNQNTFHNVTLPRTDTLGIYEANIVCSDGVFNGYSLFEFELTPTGNNQSLALLLFLVIVSAFLFGSAVMTNNGYFGFMAGCLILLTGVYVLIYGLSDITNLYTQGLSMGFIAMGIYLTIVSAYELLEEE